ncbi:MAG: acetyltransferase [Candidatus Saccharimonadota bacterium]
MTEKFGLLGNGGQAREAEVFAKSVDMELAFSAVDQQYMRDQDIDLVNPDDYQKLTGVVAAVGAPDLRREMVQKWTGEKFTTIISENAFVGEGVNIGEGSIVAPRAVLTADIEIGKHCIINVAATVSHNCIIGDYVTVSPGAHVAGNVELGDGVFVGIGATISNNIRVASGVVIGAGAVVVQDLNDENSTYVGVPAKKISTNEGWLRDV